LETNGGSEHFEDITGFLANKKMESRERLRNGEL
jgi:hypothetical protein